MPTSHRWPAESRAAMLELFTPQSHLQPDPRHPKLEPDPSSLQPGQKPRLRQRNAVLLNFEPGQRIISEGEAEHARLVSVNEVTVSAEHESSRIIGEARSEAQRLRDEVDDYVDTALANFEQFLTRSLASIERGRDKMHALREIGSFQSPENEPGPLPF